MRSSLILPALAVLQFCATSAQAGLILDFSDIPSGTLTVFAPYSSQGFDLFSSSGGFVFNSPDTGNGAPQTVGNNPFYAGANGLAAFAPSTITLLQSSGDSFSLLSIDLARNFAFDPAPSVTFTGIFAAGGTISQTFAVTTSSPPLTFQTFDFTGFTGLTAVQWDQPSFTAGLHQFGNINLSPDTSSVPEPSSLALLAIGIVTIGGYATRRKSRARSRHGIDSVES